MDAIGEETGDGRTLRVAGENTGGAGIGAARAEARIAVAGGTDISGRAPVISLDFLGLDNAEAAYALESRFGVMTRCGLHCSPLAHRTLGTFPQGTVRFSIGYYNTPEEILAAAEAVRQVALGQA